MPGEAECSKLMQNRNNSNICVLCLLFTQKLLLNFKHQISSYTLELALGAKLLKRGKKKKQNSRSLPLPFRVTGRTKHKVNRGKNGYENSRSVLLFALNKHCVYFLLFLKFLYKFFICRSEPPSSMDKGPTRFFNFMASGTARICWYSCTSSAVKVFFQ